MGGIKKIKSYKSLLVVEGLLIVLRLIATPNAIEPSIQVQTAGSITAFAWSLDGELLSAVDFDGALNVWDTTNWSTVYSSGANDPYGAAKYLRWASDRNELEIVYENNGIQIWDTQTWQIIAERPASPNQVQLVVGKVTICDCVLFATATDLILWDTVRGTVTPVGNFSDNWPNQYAMNRLSDLAYINKDQTQLRILGIGQNVANLKLEAKSTQFSALSWSPDSQKLAVASKDEGILVWDSRTGELLSYFIPSQEVIGMAWSSDGDQLATIEHKLDVYENFTLKIWSTQEKKEIVSFPFPLFLLQNTFRLDPNSLRWSTDNRFLALTGEPTSGPNQTEWGRILWVFDVEGRQLKVRLENESPFLGGIEWDPRSDILTTGSSNLLQFWDFTEKNK